MKKRIVYIFTLLLIACCVNAQESKYFEISTRRISTFLRLKDRVPPEVKENNNNNSGGYNCDFNEDYFKRASAIFKEVFKDPDPNTELLNRISFLFDFDSNYHIVYYTIKLPTELLSESLAMEEDLARFAQLIEERLDIRPYLTIILPPNGGYFPINLGALARYLKDPSYAKTYQKNNRL